MRQTGEGTMADTASTEHSLRRRLAAPLPGRAAEHPEPELVAAHAADELSPEYALAITRHLAVCDGACVAVLRDAIAGATAAREALYGPREDPTDAGTDHATHASGGACSERT